MYGKTHGQSGSYKTFARTPAYQSWHSMKQRCLNPRHASYKDYGAKGITVCERWLIFVNFYEDMGDRPNKTTLDRIENTKGYEPGNCRWATDEQQHSNQAHNGATKVTYCKRGHELTPENEIWTKSKHGKPERQCRTCHRNRARAYKTARRMAAV